MDGRRRRSGAREREGRRDGGSGNRRRGREEGRDGSREAETHPNRPIERTRDEVVFVELKRRDGSGVTDKCTVRLTGSHCA
jgi:hypothetical protein